MMELNEIYNGIKENLDQLLPKLKDLEKTVEDYRKLLSGAETELTEIRAKVEGLQMAKESMEMAGLSMGRKAPEDAISEETVKKAEEIADEHKPPKLKWTTKDAKLAQKDRNGKTMNVFRTQSAAARFLHWDQSSISRFMKLDREAQISKKNFYFAWEY